MSTEKESLSAASQTILLELARFLLQNNLSHKEFAAFSRWAFVQAGTELLGGREQMTLNRLVALTGLSRNEIAKAEANLPPDRRESERTWTDAMRVLHKWHTRTDFVDKDGKPRELDLSDPIVFRKLFSTKFGKEGEQLLAELVDAGSIVQKSSGSWIPTTRYYIPRNRELMFHYFGQAISRLISTMNRNINSPNVDAWIERMVSTVDLRSDARPLFLRVGKEQALRLIESLDDWTSSNEYQSISEDDCDQNEVGLGVYFFEDNAK